MNSRDKLQEQKCQFLKERATKYDFFSDTREVFLKRFDESNAILGNNALAKSIAWISEPLNPAQKLQDELTCVCKVLENKGCVIVRKQSNKQGRGRFKKGTSPWEQAFKWLWETKFDKWQAERNSRVGADATAIDWLDICQEMLNNQRRLTSNYLLHDNEAAKFEREQIYVPLALVQRTKPDKRDNSASSPEAGTRLYEPQYEEKQRFEHEDFLTQILERGEGKTKGKQIALIGEPGAGKTTLLHHIAFWVLGETDSPRQQDTKDVAIWVSLADLQGRSLEEYLLQTWLKKALRDVRVTPEMEDALAELFKSGRVWLLLDGIDEMTSGDPRQAIASQLTGWVASARVVLTCRLNVWQANVNFIADFETYRLLDFDYPEQVHQFIDNWFKNSDAAKGERLKVELGVAERVRLRDLVQNPLRLALLCNTWQSREEKLPETKAGLYQKFVQQFYNWKKYPFCISTQEQRNLNSALGRLAKRDIDEGGSRFRLRESFISEDLGNRDDEDSLFYKAWKLGWLNDVGNAAESATEEKVYAFFHPTFEEYFAALAIDDWDYFLPRAHIDKPVVDRVNPGKYKPYRIFEPQWKEVILLWLGREDVDKEQKEQFIKALVKFEDGCNDFYKYQADFLAANGIQEFQNCSFAQEIVNNLIKYAVGYFNDEGQEWVGFLGSDPRKEEAIQILKQNFVGREDVIQPLIKMFETYFYRWGVINFINEATEILKKNCC
jgi:predicted NACHT family NTPase